MIIAETKNFILESHPRPEISRTDGGHLVINPKIAVKDRTELSVELAKEMASLSHIAGRSMKSGLAKRGIELGRINYQDNGNWRQDLHLHLYGRAIDAIYQTYGEPVRAARKPEDKIDQEKLNTDDCEAIRSELLKFTKEEQYKGLIT